jgi:hypothetical protein
MTNSEYSFNNPSDTFALTRQELTGMPYETQFMLKIYMQDLGILMKNSYRLPEEYAGANFDYINKLIGPRTGSRAPNRR